MDRKLFLGMVYVLWDFTGDIYYFALYATAFQPSISQQHFPLLSCADNGQDALLSSARWTHLWWNACLEGDGCGCGIWKTFPTLQNSNCGHGCLKSGGVRAVRKEAESSQAKEGCCWLWSWGTGLTRGLLREASKQHSLGKTRTDLCSVLPIYTCVISHFPLRISLQPGSENEHRPLQNIVFRASQCAEKENPLGSYQPNRPNNTHYSQMPNKLATQTLPSPFSPPNETHFKSQLHAET